MPPQQIAERRRAWIIDLVGCGLAAALAAWLLIAAADESVSAIRPVSVLGASVLTYIAARLVGRIAWWLVPLAVAGAITSLIALNADEILAGAPLAGPLGYANANAALIVQGSAAALVLATVWRVWPLRAAIAGAAAILLAVSLLSGSVAAGLSFLVLLPVAAVAARPSFRRPTIAALGAMLVLAVAFTTLIGAGASRDPDQSWIRASGRALTERRVELWRDAWILARDHPLTGIGPGRFARESPTALGDPDAAWAHQAFLQLAAEAGFPAMALLVALFLWALARLAVVRPFGYVQAVAAAAMTALGLQACIDYVLHFAAVPVAAAAVLGAAVSVRTRGAGS